MAFIAKVVTHIHDSNFRCIRYFVFLASRIRGKLLALVFKNYLLYREPFQLEILLLIRPQNFLHPFRFLKNFINPFVQQHSLFPPITSFISYNLISLMLFFIFPLLFDKFIFYKARQCI